jgi:hypothetical protein
MVSCCSESPLDAEILMVHTFNWWSVLLEVICPNCPIVFHICKIYDNLQLESIRHIPVDCKREMSSFIQHCQLPVAYLGFFFGGGGSTNSVEDRENRDLGGGSPLVRGSGGSCNLVQEISFHIVKFS